MHVDRGVDQMAVQPSKPRQHAILVRSREPAVAANLCDQDRRNFPDSGHGGHSGFKQPSTKTRLSRGLFVESN